MDHKEDELDQKLVQALAGDLSGIHADEALIQRTLRTAQEKKKVRRRASRRFLYGMAAMAAGMVFVVVVFRVWRVPQKLDGMQYGSSLEDITGSHDGSAGGAQNSTQAADSFFDPGDRNVIKPEETKPSARPGMSDEPGNSGQGDVPLMQELLAIVYKRESWENNVVEGDCTDNSSVEQEYVLEKTDGWSGELDWNCRELTWQPEEDMEEKLICRVYENGRLELCHTKNGEENWYILDGWYAAGRLWEAAEPR